MVCLIYLFEPQKPVSIGTMLKNGANCKIDILVYDDVVCGPEEQDLKDYFEEKSRLPRKEPINTHVAQVL